MSFDINFYKNNNKELNFDTDYKYYVHWINNGLYENRLPNNINDNMIFYKPDKHIINKSFNDFPRKKIDIDFGLMINNVNDKKVLIKRCIAEGWITNCSIFYKLFPYSIIKKDDNNNFYIYYNNIKYDLKEFKKDFLDNDISMLFKNYNIINDSVFDSKMVTIFHIGNIDIGILMLYEMKKIDYIKNSGLIININSNIDNQSTIINYVKNNFKNNIIVNIPNLGQDISPSLIMYDILKKKDINFDYVLKLHTKGNSYWLELLTNGLINNNIFPIIELMEKEKNIGIIGSEKYNIKLKNSKNNRILLNLNYNNSQIYESHFIGGTIFLCKENIIGNVINNNMNIIKRMFITSFYVQDNSPAHALERIFGIECYINNLHIFTFDTEGNFDFNNRIWINNFEWKTYSKLYHRNKRLSKIEIIQDFLLYKGSRYGSLKDFYKDYPDFDWKFYIELIGKRRINNELSAIRHFIRKKSYLSKNHDLEENNINTKDLAILHYIKYGKKEK
jgi:hypothetical protein